MWVVFSNVSYILYIKRLFLSKENTHFFPFFILKNKKVGIPTFYIIVFLLYFPFNAVISVIVIKAAGSIFCIS